MVRQVLRDIYTKYGKDAAFNQKKLRAYLLDMRVPKKTINLLCDISRTEYFGQFAEEIKEDVAVREKLIYTTENEFAFDKGAIDYGVDCWVFAITGSTGGDVSDAGDSPDDDIWPDETAEIFAAALRELMRED